MPAPPSIVLTGHDIIAPGQNPSSTEANVGLSVDACKSLISAIEAAGYRFVPAEDFIQSWRTGGLALLTFDDAYLSVATGIAPWLSSQGIPGVMFTVTGRLAGGGDPFPIWLMALRDQVLASGDARGLGDHPLVRRALGTQARLEGFLTLPLGMCVQAFRSRLSQRDLDNLGDAAAAAFGRVTCTEQQLASLVAEGFSLGAHSVSHRSFAEIDDAEATAEITQSISDIAAVAGRPRGTVPFAYPFGAVTAQSARVVAKEALAGFTCHARPVSRLDANATLPRINLDPACLQIISRRDMFAPLREDAMRRVRASPLRDMARDLLGR